MQTLGNYNLLEQIGSGSMGTVYRACHWETKAVVAVKVMASRFSRNPVLLKRFEQEFRVASMLDHPNIVRALDYSVVNGDTPLLVMEYVEGESVGQKLDRVRRLPEEEAERIIVQVAHGLHRAHKQGLIHRDIKPDNIMVTPDGRAKILDLGLVKATDAGAELTRTGAGLGTPNYMAPEQFRNAKNVNARCDIYSLAATLYHMITGEVPFGVADPLEILMRKLRNELPSVRELVPAISERTEWTIKRAMSADPEKRPASCREFAEDLIGHSTRDRAPHPDEVAEWWMVFRNDKGQMLTATGTTRGLHRSLQEGQLGDVHAVRASRNKMGPFELLSSFPEFRDLVIGPAPGPPLSEMSCANLGRLARIARGDGEPQPPALVPPLAANDTLRESPSRPTAAFPATATPAGDKAPELPFISANLPPVRGGWADRWKILGLIVLTVVTTLLASRYLLPWLK
jgi:serine/threonine protein kinase